MSSFPMAQNSPSQMRRGKKPKAFRVCCEILRQTLFLFRPVCVLIFLSGRHAAADVAFLFVAVQHLADLKV